MKIFILCASMTTAHAYFLSLVMALCLFEYSSLDLQAYSEYCILYLFALWLHYIVRGPVQPILVKAALASALNDRDTQWLILSSSPIDNHNVTSSGITSTALRAGEKRSRAVSPDRVEVKHERSRNKMVFSKWENGEKPCQQTRTSQRRAKHDSLPLRTSRGARV